MVSRAASALLLTALLSVTAALEAASGPRRDVSHPLNTLLTEKRAELHRGVSRIPRKALGASTDRVDELVLPDAGEIAIVDNGDGVKIPDNRFDLEGKTLELLPVDADASAYLFATRGGGYDAAAAAEGSTLPLADDDSVAAVLPFEFAFFGKRRSTIFINSDGNLTFDEGDDLSTPRDPARAVSGPPRISPFFIDLDPSQPGAGVRLFASAEKFVVTWINVPEWVPAGRGRIQNFQVSLFPDGRIEFAYLRITLDATIIGLAPAERLLESLIVDFSEPPLEPLSAAFVEIFAPPDLSLAVLTQKFYLAHEDAYDFVVIFHNFDIGVETGAFAFYRGVRNFVQGIGPFPAGFEAQNVFDFGNILGSAFRLQGLLFMGELGKYPDDPGQRLSRDFGLGLNTTLSVMGQEAGHRFLANALWVDPETNRLSLELLGRDLAHWSFFFNSEASVVEGNRIVDHGAGPFRFETFETVERFGPFDLYLMGLTGPDEVSPSFFVRNPSIGDANFNPSRSPLGGILFDGERVDVEIGSVVRAMGRRRPDHTISQKHFRYAFILLVEEGVEPPPEDVAKMERIRKAFAEYMGETTGGRLVVESELVKLLALTSWPASGVLEGESIDAAVLLGSPIEEDVEVRIETSQPLVRVPETVTIPAGEPGVVFSIEGTLPGVTLLEARIGDEHETARSHIQVLGDRNRLLVQRLFPLELLLGDPRERLKTWTAGNPLPYTLLVEVIDDNGLFYADVPVRLRASGDGFATPAETRSDRFGFVLFEWTLASEPGENRLVVEIEGRDEPALVLEAVGAWTPTRMRNPLRDLFGQ